MTVHIEWSELNNKILSLNFNIISINVALLIEYTGPCNDPNDIYIYQQTQQQHKEFTYTHYDNSGEATVTPI